MNKLRIFFIILAFSSIYGSAEKQVENRQKNLKKDSYFEVGIFLGSPAFFNAGFGYWFGPVGLRLSGTYLSKDTNGIQFNLEYKLSDNAKIRHNLGIAVGRAQDPGCDYSYFGPVYDFTYKSFFLEIGAGKVFNVRRGDFSDLPYWIILQIGYVHRFFPKSK